MLAQSFCLQDLNQAPFFCPGGQDFQFLFILVVMLCQYKFHIRLTCCCPDCHAGKRAGFWTVIPCQLIVMIGLDIVYCVTAGNSMRYVYQHTCHGWRQHTCTSFGLSAWIVVFAGIQMLLSIVSFAAFTIFCL